LYEDTIEICEILRYWGLHDIIQQSEEVFNTMDDELIWKLPDEEVISD